MPRTARALSVSGIHHVSARGVGRQRIFEDTADRYRFLSLLIDKIVGRNISIAAWCLMENHFHLMVDDERGNLSTAMQSFETAYVRYFNEKTGRTGHLFQDRFFSVPVETDIQAILLADYIHMNPVKAGHGAADSYRWSSYSAYIKGYDSFDFCNPELVLELIGGSRGYADHFRECEGAYPLEGGVRWLVSDSQCIDVARSLIAPVLLDDVKALPRPERDRILITLRREGLTVKQIERLLGIGRWVIQNVTKGWRLPIQEL